MNTFLSAQVDFKDILYEKCNWVARITLNRPQAYNAYSTGTLVELAAAFRQAAFDDEVAVIVYTGAGDRAFCTGGDVKEYESTYTRSPHDYWKYMGLFSAYIESILNSGKPVIARVNGMAVGGGNESHLACDLSVIAEHAYVGQVGTGVGSVAAGGATQWLPIFVGDRRARWMLMLNRRVPPYQALEWGLVNEVVPSVKKDGSFITRATPEQIAKAQKGHDGYSIDLSALDEAVNALARELVDKFPECTRYTKQQTNFWKDLAWHQTIGHARDWLSVHFGAWEPLEA
jgi:enoyl-CoA hydratase/carnithine racemase